MKLDEAILEELWERGDGTVKEIGQRLARRVQSALNRLAAAGKVRTLEDRAQGMTQTYSVLPAPPPPPPVSIKRRV